MPQQNLQVPASWQQSRWASTRRSARNWENIGASAFVIRTLLFGVWDPPRIPFCHGRELPTVPQTAEDLIAGTVDLEEGCRLGTYQQVSSEHARTKMKAGALISSAFVTWQKSKPRFVINLREQSKHWEKRSVQMETLSSFGAVLCRGERLLSFDWKSGYRHFALHSRMWDWFIFKYDGRYYRCIALPFGWSASPYWFVKLLSPLSRYMRQTLGLRVLVWLDDYLLAPGDGSRPSTKEDCRRISSRLDKLFSTLGLLRHPDKGVWGEGETRLEHLGLLIDTVAFRYFVTPMKLRDLQQMATALLQTARKRSRWVRESLLTSFCGSAVSQLVPLPLARFFTRSLYDALKKSAPRRGRYPQQTVKISHAAVRDLQSWSTMLSGDGRLIAGGEPSWCLHTDAADVGYGGTLGRDMEAGSAGELSVQGIWSPFLRLKSITRRELTAVRFSLEDALVQAKITGDNSILLLHVDNMAVCHIISNMVSASQELMKELRLLHQVLVKMKITIRASWLPSALNKHADSLSRSWNPRDLSATPSLLESVAASLKLQTVRRFWPLGEAPMARRKTVMAQFAEKWGDGQSRLWNPPPPWIMATLLKIRKEEAHGIIVVPNWMGAPWFVMLQQLCLHSRVVIPGQGTQLFTSVSANPAWELLLAEVGTRPAARCSEGLPLSSLQLPQDLLR